MWKICVECENYEVSINGEVRRKETGKILKPKVDKRGYLEVGLSLGARGKRKMALIHRLVAQAFVPNPYNKPEVNHIDGNKQNNKCTNLEWVTTKENQNHARKTGLKPDDHGSNSPNSKLTDMEILYCRMVYKPRDKRYGASALAEKFGVSKSTMHYILNNTTYILPSSQAVRQRALIPRCVGSNPTSATNLQKR